MPTHARGVVERVGLGLQLLGIVLTDIKEAELEKIRDNYSKIARAAREALREGRPDTASPDVEIPR